VVAFKRSEDYIGEQLLPEPALDETEKTWTKKKYASS
jgi:hypothetical protein